MAAHGTAVWHAQSLVTTERGDQQRLSQPLHVFQQTGPGATLDAVATGKGGEGRMRDSAARIGREHGDPVSRMEHSPAINDEDAFVQEALRLRTQGGPGGNTYNRINSPGESILRELGF